MKFLTLMDTINEHQFLFERDVLNAPAIKQWIQDAAQRINNSNGKAWFQSQLFNYLINQSNDPQMIQPVTNLPNDAPEWLIKKLQLGSPVYQITPSDDFVQKVSETIDWVNAWTTENPNSRINYTWDQAIRAADAWHKELARGKEWGDETFDDEGIKTFHLYDDGYRWVDIQSEQCLNREGGRMGHCVGSYGGSVSSGQVRILSLRSPTNTPHVTVEIGNPNAPYWQAQDRYAAMVAAIENGSAVDQVSDQKHFSFMSSDAEPPTPPTVMSGDTLGNINQIKGKQNKPPVPKYIPYVKHLLENFPFDMSQGGEHDLETIGYYFRDHKLLSLKEVSRVIKKYPSGYKWVGIKSEGMGNLSLWGKIKLVDKPWIPVISSQLYKDGNGFKATYLETNYTGAPTDLASYIIDLFSDSTFVLADSGTNLMQFGIYNGSGGISVNPHEAAGDQLVNLENNYNILKLQTFDAIPYQSHQEESLYIFQNDKKVGKVLTNGGENNVITGITFDIEPPKNITSLIVSISKQLGLKIYQPELFGLDENYNPFDLRNSLERLETDSYSYYNYYVDVKSENGSIYVYEDSVAPPLAIIRLLDDDTFSDISSGIIGEHNDYGQLGFFIIDLVDRDMVDFGEPYDVASIIMEHGWGLNPNDNEYYYSLAAKELECRWIVTNEVTDEVISDTTTKVDDIHDDIFMGHDGEQYLTSLAQLLGHGTYWYEDEMYDDDENEDRIETHQVILTDESLAVAQHLSYIRYDVDYIRELDGDTL